MLRDKLKAQIANACGVDINEVQLEHPNLESFGDYSTNIAIKKKLDPKSIADRIPGASVAGPGFINIRLTNDELIDELGLVLGAKGQGLSGRKILVEYAHPNTHKEMHIGHMRTLITGEAIARLLEEAGATVFRANYQGDIGPHVAKSIWGTLEILKERNKTLDDCESMTLSEKAHLLGEGYICGNREYESNKDKIDALNELLYHNDVQFAAIYQQTRRWSLDYYDIFYIRFGTRFDKLFFESEMAVPGKAIVEQHLGEIFEKSDGAYIFDGEKYGLHKRVFVTSAGNPTYEGKELANAIAERQAFEFDKKVHVVANEQDGYFQVVFKAIELIDSWFVGRQHHVSMGMVNLVGKKISSRTGEIITVDDLLDEVKELIKPLMKEADDKVLEAVTIGAVKYSVLKTHPSANAVFDIKQSVALQGNSGPYLQYTFARTQSVLAKSRKSNDKLQMKFKIQNLNVNSEETAILRWVYRFPEVVEEAAGRYSPNLLCNFLFELAQRYNTFYNMHPILGNEFRLTLTKLVGEVLKKGLNLLGISAPEKM